MFRDRGLEGTSHHAIIPNVNRVGDLRKLAATQAGGKKLFDAVARSSTENVAAADHRYRQVTVTMDVRGFASRAKGCGTLALQAKQGVCGGT